MALTDKINTAKEVLGDTRSRMVVIILSLIVVIVMVIAFIKFKRASAPPSGLGSSVTETPNISSIPGLGNPSREYAKLQEQQNANLASEAKRKGTSAIPTLVRTTYIDSGVSDDQSGSTSAEGCGIEELKRARASGVTASELRCRGCSAAALKAAGYSAADLKAAGFSAADLKAAGFSEAELRAAGYGATDLKAAGFSAKDLHNANLTAGELAKAGYSANELHSAGYTDDEVKNATGICDATKLRDAKSKGISAADLRKSGCSAAALKAAGYTAAELKAAGFSAADLKNAGFSAKELKDAGFSAAELKAAGFSAKDLKDAGFTPDDLLGANYTKGDLTRAGVDSKESVVATNSCDVSSLKKARDKGETAGIFKKLGCSASALKNAGYSADELKKGNFSEKDLEAAGFLSKPTKKGGENSRESSSIKKNINPDPYSGLQSDIARMHPKEMEGMSEDEIKTFLNQQQALMTMQANKLFAAWTPVAAQQYVHGVEKTEKGSEKKTELTEEQKKQELLKSSDIYKAGTIIFAILDTGVNSDESSPVMATVVQGPLKGSKVIGNFQRVDKKLLLQFSVLSVPRLESSISVNAVAIDPNTAKTALASEVDSHYMLRYGTLFASSFVSGIGKAFQTAGSQVETTTSGSVSSMPELNTTEKVMVGLGNVGQQFSTAMSSKVNIPPTVKINSGSSIGILLMADLPIPKKAKIAN